MPAHSGAAGGRATDVASPPGSSHPDAVPDSTRVCRAQRVRPARPSVGPPGEKLSRGPRRRGSILRGRYCHRILRGRYLAAQWPSLGLAASTAWARDGRPRRPPSRLRRGLQHKRRGPNVSRPLPLAAGNGRGGGQRRCCSQRQLQRCIRHALLAWPEGRMHSYSV